jgi:hypothetical protein
LLIFDKLSPSELPPASAGGALNHPAKALAKLYLLIFLSALAED